MITIFQSNELNYPQNPPFHPPEDYPEYPFKGTKAIDVTNLVYAAVRRTLELSCLNQENFGTPDWNPLSIYVKPGDKVLIKPNMVRDIHYRGLSLDSVVTHGSVIRAVIDYVLIALKGRGEIIVGDAPLQTAKFDVIVQKNGLKKVIEFIQAKTDIKVRLIDFRSMTLEKNRHGLIKKKTTNFKDNAPYALIDIGTGSFLTPIQNHYKKFRVTNYEPEKMTAHHGINKHEYLISKYVVESDVIVNIPKLKTHRKAGISVAMKNLVGINISKDCLPHHTRGSLEAGGDEYKNTHFGKAAQSNLLDIIESTNSKIVKNAAYWLRHGLKILSIFKPYHDPYREGSWYGNDTVWRMILDLNRIALYTDISGLLTENRQRNYLVIVDGIMAGEGDGPLSPTPRPSGLILMGSEPSHIDFVSAMLMGFSPDSIPTVRNGIRCGLFGNLDTNAIKIFSNRKEFTSLANIVKNNLGFEPCPGWKGHIELKK